jgi:uncharacterized protein (TIGR02246 family)
MTEDERAIRNLVDTWMLATQQGDVETVLNLMSDDVVFMVPGQKPFGKEAFANMSRTLEGVRFEGRSDIEELTVLGNWAYLRNHIEMTMTRAGGAPIRRGGYTLAILRKQEDGRWVLVRDANLVTTITG